MTAFDPETEQKLEKLIKSAGERIMELWPGNPKAGKLKTYAKPDSTYVTEADYASNEIIVSGLKQLFPDDGIWSEELPRPENLESLSRVWIIDPIDGTHPFMAGEDNFSIFVALAVKGKPSFGVILSPVAGFFGIGSVSTGARVNGLQARVSPARSLEPGSVHWDRAPLDSRRPIFSEDRGFRSALSKICTGVSSGMIWRVGGAKEWDLAAPAALVAACGGRVTNERGEELILDGRKIDFQQIVFSNGAVHEELLELLD